MKHVVQGHVDRSNSVGGGVIEVDELYPGQYVLNGDRVTGYQTACLAAGVWATRAQVNKDGYREAIGIGDGSDVPVQPDWPEKGQKYPYIHVAWQNSKFEPTTLEEGRLVTYVDRDGEGLLNDECSLYRFEGSYTIGIYATRPFERARISDALIGALGIDDSYRDMLYRNPYVSLAPNMHTLAITAQSDTVGTPWDSDAMTSFCQMSFRCNGEFLYRHGVEPRFLTRIEVLGVLDDGGGGACAGCGR